MAFRGRPAACAAFSAALFANGVQAQPQSQSQAGEAGAGAQPVPQALLTWRQFLARPRPKPQLRVAYGAGPSQFAELWLPSGPGTHPVVAFVHGGCWQASIADLSYMDYAAEDLRRRGVAVWNIEYRRVDQPGGGYPGTFQDVGAAIDRLGLEAPKHGLTLKHLIVVGHSAGGHLALWSAARWKLPRSSPLHWSAPLPVAAVVDIAGIPNLKTDTATACGAEVLSRLTGPPAPGHRNVYADTSPSALLPLGAPQVVAHGAQDVTVPPAVGLAYARAARSAGDTVVIRSPPGGHVEEVAPGSPAWAQIADVIVTLANGGTVR